MNYKLLILNIIFASICLVFLVLTYIYINTRTAILVNTVNNTNAEMARNTQLRNEATVIRNLFNKIDDKKDVIRESFVTEAGIIDPIKALESMGTQTGATMNIAQVSILKGDQGKNVALNMKVTAQGNWASIYKTLILLENISYVSTIEKMTLESASINNMKSWVLSADIKMAMRE